MKIELKASKVAPGHLVIVNDCDCPSLNMLAVVKEIKEDRWSGYYVSEYLTMRNDGKRYAVGGRIADATPINAFGVRIYAESRDPYPDALVSEMDPSLTATATYPDGRPRKWQEACPRAICMNGELMIYINQA